MNFKPFHSLVLVERLDGNQTKKTGIIMPERHEARFWKVIIIATGFDVPPGIIEGQVCYCNPLPEIDDIEAFDNPNYRLVNFGHILGRLDE